MAPGAVGGAGGQREADEQRADDQPDDRAGGAEAEHERGGHQRETDEHLERRMDWEGDEPKRGHDDEHDLPLTVQPL